MMAAGKVSKFAEGVPSLKLNLKRRFRENEMKISPLSPFFTSLSSLLSSHSSNLGRWF